MSRAEDPTSTIERMIAIKALPVLSDVHPDELAVVAEHVHLCTFPAGETLYAGAREPVSTIHLVLDGRVSERRGGRLFVTHGPEHILGGEDALALSATDVVAVAEEDTRTLAIERDKLRDVLEDNFGVLSATLQGVAAATLRLRRRLVPSAGYATAEPPASDSPPLLDDLGARVAFLWEHTWLKHARAHMLGPLASDATSITFGAGERLWAAGDRAEHALIVVAGGVHCETDDGRQHFAAARGAILGLDEALAMDARWYGATANTPGAALRITRASLVDALEDDSDSALALLAAFAAVASGLRDEVARASGDET